MSEEKRRSLRSIEMTPQNFSKAIELALAATDATNWGPMPTAELRKIGGLGSNAENLECVWIADEKEGNLVCAITGDGPSSKANAEFYVNARPMVLGLVEKVDELETKLRTLEAQLAAAQRNLGDATVTLGRVTSGYESAIALIESEGLDDDSESSAASKDCVQARELIERLRARELAGVKEGA